MNCVPGPLRLCPGDVGDFRKTNWEDDWNPKKYLRTCRRWELPANLVGSMFIFGDDAQKEDKRSTQWCDECKERGSRNPPCLCEGEGSWILLTKHQPDILFVEFAICHQSMSVMFGSKSQLNKLLAWKTVVWIIWDQIQTHGEAIFYVYANQVATREWHLQRSHVCVAFLWENYHPCFHYH